MGYRQQAGAALAESERGGEGPPGRPGPGSHVGPYEIVREIGSGSVGSVFLARNPLIDRQVALKVFEPGAVPGMHPETARRLFLNESRIAGRLEHPSIVRLYDAGEADGQLYLAMELVGSGRSVQRYCRSPESMLPLEEAVRVVRQCAEALHHAHGHGIVHRDVKPRNILLDQTLRPKITDFGVAVVCRPDSSMTHLAGAGSPLYMSPEQILNEICTPASDIYSLGVVLYELLVGRPPFTADSLNGLLSRIVGEPHRPPRTLRGDLPRELDHIANRVLAKSPARRYQSALDLAADLALVEERLVHGVSVRGRRALFERVRPLAFFEGFTDREVREVVDCATVERYRADQDVFREGDDPSCFHVVVRGSVAVCRGERPLAHLGPGECFGELGVLSGRSRTARVTASTATEVMAVPRAILERSTPGCQLRLKDYFLRTLGDRLADTLELVC